MCSWESRKQATQCLKETRDEANALRDSRAQAIAQAEAQAEAAQKEAAQAKERARDAEAEAERKAAEAKHQAWLDQMVPVPGYPGIMVPRKNLEEAIKYFKSIKK